MKTLTNAQYKQTPSFGHCLHFGLIVFLPLLCLRGFIYSLVIFTLNFFSHHSATTQLYAAMYITCALSAPMAGLWTDRYPLKTLILLALTLSCTALLAFAWVSQNLAPSGTTFALMLSLCVLVGIGYALYFPVYFALNTLIFPEKLRERVIKLITLANMFAFFSSPILVQICHSTLSLSWPTMFLVEAILIGLCGGLALTFRVPKSSAMDNDVAQTGVIRPLWQLLIYLHRKPLSRMMILNLCIALLCVVGPFEFLLPIFFKQVVAVSGITAGLLMGTIGAGITLGTLASLWVDSAGREHWLIPVLSCLSGLPHRIKLDTSAYTHRRHTTDVQYAFWCFSNLYYHPRANQH